MLENLSDRFGKVLKYLKGEAQINASNLEKALKEIRLSLLEADVNYKVVKAFVERIRVKALGAEVQESLNPYQQVVKVVRDELRDLLGRDGGKLREASIKPTLVMFAGLQGCGKTTSAGKLGLHLRKQQKSVLLCSLDLKRPAAREQLEILCREAQLAYFKGASNELMSLAAELKKHALDYGYDYVLVDTAGRLHAAEDLLQELADLKKHLNPLETVFVADALTGQDAVNSARAFLEKVGFDSIILTKLDADTRGGAALSIVSVLDRPIIFAGTGEKPGDLEPFHPERMASRILGLGDVLTLIEKAEQSFDEKQARRTAEKLKKNEFDLEDFRQQLEQMKKMGPLSEIMGMLPGGMARGIDPAALDEKRLVHLSAIILSMTPGERRNPKIIDGRRRQRIARGSGRSVQEINQLLKNFFSMKQQLRNPLLRRMMKRFDF